LKQNYTPSVQSSGGGPTTQKGSPGIFLKSLRHYNNSTKVLFFPFQIIFDTFSVLFFCLSQDRFGFARFSLFFNGSEPHPLFPNFVV
jgi:hypothetical protein